MAKKPQTGEFHLRGSQFAEVQRQVARLRENPNRPKIGLALGGGGARGLAHVGVLLALAQLELPIDYIAGTSAGSIAGAALAAGIHPQELLDIVFDSAWWFMMKPGVFEHRGGVLSSAGLERWISGWLGYKTFADLEIPLQMIATDLVSGDMVILGEGRVAKAARISSTVPGLYAPVEVEGRLLADGGLVCNLPVQVVRSMGADIVIAVDLNAVLSSGSIRTFTEVVCQAILIVQRANERQQIDQAELVIQPDLGRFTPVDFEAVEQQIRSGVTAVDAELSGLLSLVECELAKL